MIGSPTICTAFQGPRRLASGPAVAVALALKAALDRDPGDPCLVFDDATGRELDFDLRGTEADIRARLDPASSGAAEPDAAEPAARGPGRPRLGVVAREVTLLPRHWDWLSTQPGGASVALRRLVEAARAANAAGDRARRAREAADRFMTAMAGNQPGYEEASRALYAGNRSRFEALTAPWPDDVRDHARRLAEPGWVKAGE